MAKRRTPRAPILDDAADAERVLVARLEFLKCLCRDPRVQAAIRQWAATPSGQQSLTTISEAADNVVAESAWDQERPAAGAHLTASVGLSCPWLSRWLADAGLLMAIQEAAEWRRVVFMFEATGEPGYLGPRARRAKHHGATIARDVRWFYRAKVKTPPDTIGLLTREYEQAERRRTPALSVVQDGIARAKVLLNLTSKPRPRPE